MKRIELIKIIRQENYRDRLTLSLSDVDIGRYVVNYSESSFNSYDYDKTRIINARMKKNDFRVDLRIASLNAHGRVHEERGELPKNAVSDAKGEANQLWESYKHRFDMISGFYDLLAIDKSFLETIYDITMSNSRPMCYEIHTNCGNTLCSKLEVHKDKSDFLEWRQWELGSNEEENIRERLLSELGAKKLKEFLDSVKLSDKEKDFWENYIQNSSFHHWVDYGE